MTSAPRAYYIVLSITGKLDEVGHSVRRSLGLPHGRTSSTVAEPRFGLNWGGHYFMFEWDGAVMYLVGNEGEASIDISSKPYFLVLGERWPPAGLLEERLQEVTKRLAAGAIGVEVIAPSSAARAQDA